MANRGNASISWTVATENLFIELMYEHTIQVGTCKPTPADWHFCKKKIGELLAIDGQRVTFKQIKTKKDALRKKWLVW